VDWESHFKKVSKGKTQFGTFMGQQTVGELRDLINAQDNQLAQIEHELTMIPTSDDEIFSDFAALKVRYKRARDVAQNSINNASTLTGWTVLPDSVRTVQPEFDGVLRALKQVPGTVTKGDLADIAKRMGPSLYIKPLPQPKAADLDLKGYKAADDMTKQIEKVVKGGTPWMLAAVGILIGVVVLKVVL
jgi:hypothetical protein